MVDKMKKNILVVGGSSDTNHLIKIVLKDEYEVATATGVISIVTIEKKKPDLIIMSTFDGFEGIKTLRNNTKTKKIPIIFLTAMDDVPTEVMAFELGAEDVILKPFNIQVFKARINRVFR